MQGGRTEGRIEGRKEGRQEGGKKVKRLYEADAYIRARAHDGGCFE